MILFRRAAGELDALKTHIQYVFTLYPLYYYATMRGCFWSKASSHALIAQWVFQHKSRLLHETQVAENKSLSSCINDVHK